MPSASSNFEHRDDAGIDSPTHESGDPLLPTINPLKKPRFNRNSTTAMDPVYTIASDFWQSRQSRQSTRMTYTPSSITEEEQRFIETLSQVVTSTDACQGQSIMILADVEEDIELLNGEWGATSNFVYALLQEKPTTMTARVAIIGYLQLKFSWRVENI